MAILKGLEAGQSENTGWFDQLIGRVGGGGCSTPRHEHLGGMGLTWRSGDTWKVYLQALKWLADFESYLLGIYL